MPQIKVLYKSHKCNCHSLIKRLFHRCAAYFSEAWGGKGGFSGFKRGAGKLLLSGRICIKNKDLLIFKNGEIEGLS